MVKSPGPLPLEASHATEYFELLKLCVDAWILEPTELKSDAQMGTCTHKCVQRQQNEISY